MHPRWPARERVEEVWTATKSRAELPRSRDGSIPPVLPLAHIDKFTASPTGEGSAAASEVDFRRASAAAVAPKPGTEAAEMALRPQEQHTLRAQGFATPRSGASRGDGPTFQAPLACQRA